MPEPTGPNNAGRRMRLLVVPLGIAVSVALLAVALWEAFQAPPAPSHRAPAARLPFARLADPSPAPPLNFVNAAGKRLSLANFRGEIVLLNVWATWCPPCRREMPELDRLQQALGSRSFQVVALSIDVGGARVVKRFFNAIGVHALKVYVDPTMHAAEALRIPGTPTTFLINRSGLELARHVGPAEWDAPATIGFLRKLVAATRPDRGHRGAG